MDKNVGQLTPVERSKRKHRSDIFFFIRNPPLLPPLNLHAHLFPLLSLSLSLSLSLFLSLSRTILLTGLYRRDLITDRLHRAHRAVLYIHFAVR